MLPRMSVSHSSSQALRRASYGQLRPNTLNSKSKASSRDGGDTLGVCMPEDRIDKVRAIFCPDNPRPIADNRVVVEKNVCEMSNLPAGLNEEQLIEWSKSHNFIVVPKWVWQDGPVQYWAVVSAVPTPTAVTKEVCTPKGKVLVQELILEQL
jgi:hypothetical protein